MVWFVPSPPTAIKRSAPAAAAAPRIPATSSGLSLTATVISPKASAIRASMLLKTAAAFPPAALALTMIIVRILPFLRQAVGGRPDKPIASGFQVPAFVLPSKGPLDQWSYLWQQTLAPVRQQDPETETPQKKIIQVTDRSVAGGPAQLNPA